MGLLLFLQMSNNFIQNIVKKFNSEDVITFAEKDGFSEIKSWAHSSSGLLDYNLGTLGFPTGIIELAGKSRSGKTTLGLEGMKNFLKENPEVGIAVILSSENRDNKEYAKRLGIDTSKVIIIKIRYVESMFLRVKSLIKECEKYFEENKMGIPKFYFLWDSLGATLSKSELDTMDENVATLEKKAAKGDEITELKHEKIGAFAKPAKMFAKFLLGEMYSKVIHFIILNHQYDKIGGHGRQSTGGEWIELFPTIRLQTSIKENVKVGDEEVAQITVVKVIKNDFGSRRPTDVEILLGYGIVLSEDEIAFGIESGIIEKVSAKKHSFLGGKLTWSTKREFYDLYISGNKFLPILQKKIRNAYHDVVRYEKIKSDE